MAALGLGACCVLPLALGGLSLIAGVVVGSGLLVIAGVLALVLWGQRRSTREVKGEARAH